MHAWWDWRRPSCHSWAFLPVHYDILVFSSSCTWGKTRLQTQFYPINHVLLSPLQTADKWQIITSRRSVFDMLMSFISWHLLWLLLLNCVSLWGQKTKQLEVITAVNLWKAPLILLLLNQCPYPRQIQLPLFLSFVGLYVDERIPSAGALEHIDVLFKTAWPPGRVLTIIGWNDIFIPKKMIYEYSIYKWRQMTSIPSYNCIKLKWTLSLIKWWCHLHLLTMGEKECWF